MCNRLLTFHPVWKVARSSLVVGLLALSGAYGILGDELFHRIGGLIDRAGCRISDAATELRLRTAATGLGSSNDSFEQLLGYRETLDQQVSAVQEQRGLAALRLEEDGRLLTEILGVLEGQVGTSGGDRPRAVVEEDAAVVLGRVQGHQRELKQCDSLLSRISEDLVKLEQEIEKAHCSLQQRADDLARQKAIFAAQQAYRDGLNLARRLNAGE